MSRIKSLIKLTNLNSEKLDEKFLHHVFGGEYYCGCFYEACGGSTRYNNDRANLREGLVSPLPPLENPNWGIVPPDNYN